MDNKKSSILLVDDHPLLRKGLKQLLAFEEELEVIAEASNGEEALVIAEREDPDLIILDLNMQGMDGLQTLSKLREIGVTSRIVMLTVSDSDVDVLEAISKGADGYLLKDTDPDLLLEQIKQSITGKMVLSESVTQVWQKLIGVRRLQQKQK